MNCGRRRSRWSRCSCRVRRAVHCAGGRSCGVHRHRVRADQRMRMAGSAALVRVPFHTAHRRFSQWTKAGLWRGLEPRGSRWCLRQGQKRGSLTGRSPVDRGKPGSKIHALSDRAGLPLPVAVSAANTHDSAALKPLVMAIRSRRGPQRRKPAKLHADKAYDHPDLRRWVRDRGRQGSHRPHRNRSQGQTRRAPLGDRTNYGLVHWIPPSDSALRTQSRALPRLPRTRRHGE